jgi:hypothetical protein
MYNIQIIKTVEKSVNYIGAFHPVWQEFKCHMAKVNNFVDRLLLLES